MKKKNESVDSKFSSQMSQKAGTLGTKKTRFQYNGKEIQDILGIHDESPNHSKNSQNSLSMMDIIVNNWDDDSGYEKDEDTDEEFTNDEEEKEDP
jgi:hypothetical protein